MTILGVLLLAFLWLAFVVFMEWLSKPGEWTGPIATALREEREERRDDD